jgi:hypothetical protein
MVCLALVGVDDRDAVAARGVARARQEERDTRGDIGLTDEALLRLERDCMDELLWLPRSAQP